MDLSNISSSDLQHILLVRALERTNRAINQTYLAVQILQQKADDQAALIIHLRKKRAAQENELTIQAFRRAAKQATA